MSCYNYNPGCSKVPFSGDKSVRLNVKKNGIYELSQNCLGCGANEFKSGKCNYCTRPEDPQKPTIDWNQDIYAIRMLSEKGLLVSRPIVSHIHYMQY